MATQMVTQSACSTLFSGNYGISMEGGIYDLQDLSKPDLAAPRLIMLANVALNGEMNSSCCDYVLDEDRQMVELTTVNDCSFSDSDGERMDESQSVDSDSGDLENMETEIPETEKNYSENQITLPPNTSDVDIENNVEATSIENKNKCMKTKPFRCKPCKYRAESEEEFVEHIKIHSAKIFFDHDTKKKTHVKESDSCSTEETDFSKGPIRCDRCGYNTNRFDHYLAHLKHHNKVGDSERVYKCSICTYTTVSEYHWKKHLRNHFPRKVYTCSQCSYFSDRKNNYIQHVRTHTGERPYQCIICPYSSSQKTHLTRHMRTHSGEKPFKCEQCSYVASNQHEVTRHARQVHNGPKPLTCPHCEYKTADRSNFKKHVELHVNPRQFMCPVCEYAASKKCNLQYHIKSRHLGCTAITMDVSNVKLRSKKGEVDGNACDENKPGLNDNLNLDGKEKQIDKIVHVEKKEKIRKGKKQVAASFAGQVKTRSFRSSVRNKLKLANEKGSEKLSKDKHGKRINGISAKKIKRTDAGGAKIKKKKLVPRSKHSRVALKKEIKSVSSQKQKMCIQSKREIRDLKNKLRKKTSKRDCMSKRQGKQIILELGTDTDNQVKQQMILEHLAEMPDMINSSDNTQNSQDTPEIATGIVDILEQGPGENLPEDVPNNICVVESSKCLVLSEKPKDSLTNKHTNRSGQNYEHIVNTKVNPTCKSQKEMDKPENNSKLGESIEPFQYLKQLSVESTEHSLYLGQVSMESAEPSKCLDELPVGSVKPSQCLGELPVESAEPSQCLDELPVESAEPSQCLDELPVESAEPSQCLHELPVESAEPSQCLDELPVESAEPSQCLDGLSVEFTEPSPCLAELPVESAKPSQCLNELPVESAEPSPCLAQLPVESAEPSQCLDELPVESAEPSQCLDGLSVEFAEPSPCLAQLPIESAEPSQCLDGLSVEFAEPSPSLAELLVESAVPSPCLAELPVEFAEPCLAELPVDSAEPSLCLAELPVDSAEPSSCLAELPVDSAEPSSCLAELPVESTEPSLCLAELPVDSAEPSPCLAELPVEYAKPSPCLAELPVESAELSLCLAELPVESPERFQYTNKTTDSTKIQNPDKVPIENGYFFKPPSKSDSVSESVTDQTKNLHTLCEEQQRKYKTTKAKTLNINNNSKEILHSQSAFSSSNGETVDVEDDEGIHSHEGSDISDNISERSDDSGLNGMPSVQTKEIKAAELSLSSMETNISKDRYVCIFCDRSLKEVDYTKHLKRHLVNVYYLEKAANDQT